MPTFFTRKQTQGCRVACHLNRGCVTPAMQPTGKGLKKILVVAEAPGKNEDQQGVQLVGKAGQVLRRELSSLGIDLDRDCRKTNAICCRPPDNRIPKPEEIAACRPLLWKEIGGFKPQLILLLGRVSIMSFLGDVVNDIDEMTRWRGQVWPDRRAGCWVSATYHPSYILRVQEYDLAIKKVFQLDLKHALSYSDAPFPTLTPEEPKVRISTTTDEILSWLEIANRSRLLAFDYETTGRKPQAEGHRILCASFSTDGESAYAFPISDRQVQKEWVRMLWSKDVKKIAHNMKFEEMWSRVRLGVRVKGWTWDSMLAAHVLDNRRHSTDLKFQALINFGVYDYSSFVEPYITRPLNRDEEAKGANAINRADSCPLDKLLTYCGMDSMLEYRLAMAQMKKMGWRS